MPTLEMMWERDAKIAARDAEIERLTKQRDALLEYARSVGFLDQSIHECQECSWVRTEVGMTERTCKKHWDDTLRSDYHRRASLKLCEEATQ
jgi:uncharacterized caspase-like protein